MKILITGGSGLLGKSLLETRPNNVEIALTWNKNINGMCDAFDLWYKLDIKSRSEVFEVFEMFRPEVVIHCASIGSVDYTERHYQEVREVNVTGLGNIIDAANGYKSKVIYISTNAVYSGNLPLYNETSPLEPVNSYGVIKKEAENLVKSLAHKWLIFRPFMLYGWPYIGGRSNWVVRIIYELQQDRKLELVNDIYWMPTYAPDCAEAIWKLLFQFDHEVFNISAPEKVTLYEFGLHVCEMFGLDADLLSPVRTKESWDIAKRPRDTTYDLGKLSMQGIMLSDIKTGLEKMKEAGKNEL